MVREEWQMKQETGGNVKMARMAKSLSAQYKK